MSFSGSSGFGSLERLIEDDRFLIIPGMSTIIDDDDGDPTSYLIFGFVINPYDNNPSLPPFITVLKNVIIEKLKKGKKCKNMFLPKGFRNRQLEIRELMGIVEKMEGKNYKNDIKKRTSTECAVLLRLFYGRMTSPLISRKKIKKVIGDKFIRSEGSSSGNNKYKELSEEGKNELKGFLSEMSSGQRYFLKDLIQFVHTLSEYEKIHSMKLEKIGMSFALHAIYDIGDSELIQKKDERLYDDIQFSFATFHSILINYLSWF